jgi:hypothetical protein
MVIMTLRIAAGFPGSGAPTASIFTPALPSRRTTVRVASDYFRYCARSLMLAELRLVLARNAAALSAVGRIRPRSQPTSVRSVRLPVATWERPENEAKKRGL